MTPTSTRTQREVSVLAFLRAVVPQRPVSYAEALRIAELQANKLREHFGIDAAAVPSELIFDIPRISVDYDHDMPVSGSTHWNGHRWIITLNASEPAMRQRFSLMHEFKHIVDHTSRHLLYGRHDDPQAGARAERVADYFAACLLMPKRWVKHYWGEGIQTMTGLSSRFGVSTQAMRYRLLYLGLIETPPRCRPTCLTPRTNHWLPKLEAAA